MAIELPSSLQLPQWQTKNNCYRLVRTISRTLGRPTNRLPYLKNSTKGNFTDGRGIWVELQDPEAYLVTGHELSHLVFGSDPGATVVFCKQNADEIVRDFLVQGAPILRGQEEKVAGLLKTLSNLLDDHRCAYWWGQVYPGDYIYLQKRWLRFVSARTNEAKKNLMQFVRSVMMGVAPPDADTDFLAVQDVIEQAINDVKNVDYPTCLAITRKLFDKLIRVLSKQMVASSPGMTKPQKQAFRTVVMVGQSDPTPLEADGVCDVKPSKWLEDRLDEGRVPPAIQDLVNQAMGLVGAPDDALAGNGSDAMDKVVQDIREAEEDLDRDEWLLQDTKAKVTFRDVSPDDLVERQLSSYEESAVKRARSRFVQIQGRKNYTPQEMGEFIDIQALIQRRLTREGDCFLEESRRRGFHYMLLIDGSSSMHGPKYEAVCKAAQILSTAMNFPFVEGEAWVYRTESRDETVLSRVPAPLRLMPKEAGVVGGMTPTHTAIYVAGRQLKTFEGARILFHLTDGAPNTQPKAESFVRSNVLDLRAHGIPTFTLYVGNNWNRRTLTYMSAGQKYYTVCSPDEITPALVKLVERRFEEYLTDRG